MKSIAFNFFVLICFTLGLSGCSINRMAAKTTIGVMAPASEAFYEEEDLELAREGLPANLKMMEGLLKAAPDDERLLVLLAQGFCSYSFAFLEESTKPGDVERANKMYLRGYHYGLKALPASLNQYATGDLELFEKAVNQVNDVAPLFWTAYCFGNWVNLNKSDVKAVAELSRVELMMRKVLQLDPQFYNASAHTFYGVYYGSRPKMLGGNPEKAKEHFDQAIQFTQGKFLMPKLFKAQFYAVPIQDEALFEKLLKEVIEASDSIFPEQKMANLVAKKRALALMKEKKNLF